MPAGRFEHGDRFPLDDAVPNAGTPGVDLLEGGTGPPWWQTRWTALPRVARRLLALLSVLLLLGAGLVWGRGWAAERELRQRVDLGTSLGVWSSSTSPPGGAVGYFLLVRNDGPRPVWVTGVEGAGDRLRLKMRDEGSRRVSVGREIDIPMSVRLTCAADDGPSQPGLSVEITVRREDGDSTTERAELRPAALLLDAAAILCRVRPELRNHELSGPVVRAGP